MTVIKRVPCARLFDFGCQSGLFSSLPSRFLNAASHNALPGSPALDGLVIDTSSARKSPEGSCIEAALHAYLPGELNARLTSTRVKNTSGSAFFSRRFESLDRVDESRLSARCFINERINDDSATMKKRTR